MATFFAAAGRGLGQLLDDRDTPKGVTVRRPSVCVAADRRRVHERALVLRVIFDGCFYWRWTAAFLLTSWT